MDRLAALDLNLVLLLHVLLEERSVTKAAKRLSLSQPAVSHALGRLREQLGDELLVREGRSMVPTSFATGLATPLSAALTSLDRVLANQGEFDAASSSRSFVVAADNLVSAVSLPMAQSILSQRAPKTQIAVVASERAFERQLEDGRVDLAFGPTPATAGHIMQVPLYDDTWVCAFSKDHAPSADFSLDEFCRRQHVMMSPSGSGPSFVDDILAASNHARNIGARVPDFLSVVVMVAQTDLITVIPARLGEVAMRLMPVHCLPLPFAIPDVRIFMSWHARSDQDPAHRWLRELILSVEKAWRIKHQGFPKAGSVSSLLINDSTR